MSTVTIPKEFAGRQDLVAIPRDQYEAFLVTRKFKSIKATPIQKKSFAKAERNLKLGKTLSYNEFAKRLAR